jgi:Protein of unknown function (DUF2934)
MLADDDFVRTLDELDRHGCAETDAPTRIHRKEWPPKPWPNRRYSRPAPSNQSGQSYPATDWSDRIDTNPNRSQPAGGGSKRLTLLQASILVAPIAGAESCPKIHRTTHQSERPASGNARTNFWEEDGRPEGREQEYWEPAEVNDS